MKYYDGNMSTRKRRVGSEIQYISDTLTADQIFANIVLTALPFGLEDSTC